MLLSLILSTMRIFLRFFQNLWGTLNSPYETWKKLVKEKDLAQVILWGFLLWFYLSLAVVVKNGLSTGPLFLTFSLSRLFYASLLTFLVVSVVIFLIGRFFGGKGELKEVICSWVFSYFSTLSWFFLTTVFYVLLPPPRTHSFLGQIFTLFFLTFSFSLLFWKFILYYLTLRLALKMTLWQITRATMVILPILFLWFLLLNRLGVFKIPLA